MMNNQPSEKEPVAPPKDVYQPPRLNDNLSVTEEGVPKAGFSPSHDILKDSGFGSNEKSVETFKSAGKEGDEFVDSDHLLRPDQDTDATDDTSHHLISAVFNDDDAPVISQSDHLVCSTNSNESNRECSRSSSSINILNEDILPDVSSDLEVVSTHSDTRDCEDLPPHVSSDLEVVSTHSETSDCGDLPPHVSSDLEALSTHSETSDSQDNPLDVSSKLEAVFTHSETRYGEDIPSDVSSDLEVVSTSETTDCDDLPPDVSSDIEAVSTYSGTIYSEDIPSDVSSDLEVVSYSETSDCEDILPDVSSNLEAISTHSETSDSDIDIISDSEPDETASVTQAEGPSTDPENGENLGLFGRRVSMSSSPLYVIYATGGQDFKIVMERKSVFEAFCDIYGKSMSVLLNVEYGFMDEPGEGYGPTKEAFTQFHTAGKYKLYEGQGELIPRTIGPNSIVLARVLYHQFMLTLRFPVFLCKAFIIEMLTGRDIREYDEQCLLKSFINAVLIKNQVIFLSAVNNGLGNMSENDMMTLFMDISEEMRAANLEHRDITKENWKEILLDLAHFVLLEKQSCREVIEEFQICMQFGGYGLCGVDDARNLVGNIDPTAASILLKIEYDIQHDAERQAWGFLFRFIASHCNNRDIAERFLMFCTSCTCLPFEPIKISFNAVGGLNRSVTANTCDNLLHVPTTYESYREFQEEFMNILTNNDSFIFSFN